MNWPEKLTDPTCTIVALAAVNDDKRMVAIKSFVFKDNSWEEFHPFDLSMSLLRKP